jgi:murein DD-endopeptidase MepM/ murein hydrolase activator NlpD
MVLVQVEGTRPGDRVEGSLGERKLRFYLDKRKRVRAISAIALSQAPGGLSLTVTVTPKQGDPIIAGIPVPVRPGEFEEQELSVDPKYVKPPKRVKARIRRERKAMKRLWARKPTRRKWRGNFVWPRKDVICSAFGLKRMFNGELQSRHYGVDIDGRTGSPIRAIGAGRVVMVSNRYYAGGTVVIDHGLKLFSLYFHMSEFSVKTGEQVKKGQLIGKVGRTGRVTGPHVHLSTKIEGLSFDPLSLLEFDFPADVGEKQP